MMSKLNAFLLAGALTLLPASAMAEISLADMVETNTTMTLDESLDLDLNLNADTDFARGRGPGRATPPRPHHGHAAPPPPRHHTTRVYRTNVRPRYVSRPVVVVDSSPVVVKSSSTPKIGSTFGFGVRGLGFLSSESYDSEVAWGGGYYIKYRPTRWVSLEFVNDFVATGETIRIPASLGLRAHIFDYGSLDVYGVAAAAVTSIDDSGEFYYQIGGQFGAGVSILLGVFELGVEARYTIDAYMDNVSEIEHGLNFSLNLGFGF